MDIYDFVKDELLRREVQMDQLKRKYDDTWINLNIANGILKEVLLISSDDKDVTFLQLRIKIFLEKCTPHV